METKPNKLLEIQGEIQTKISLKVEGEQALTDMLAKALSKVATIRIKEQVPDTNPPPNPDDEDEPAES